MEPLAERDKLIRQDVAVLREWTLLKEPRDALQPRVLTLIGPGEAAPPTPAVPTAEEFEAFVKIEDRMAALWERHEVLQRRIVELNAFLPRR